VCFLLRVVWQLAAIRSIIEADLCRFELEQSKAREPDCPATIAECIEGVVKRN
jgi:hypothetical protein